MSRGRRTPQLTQQPFKHLSTVAIQYTRQCGDIMSKAIAPQKVISRLHAECGRTIDSSFGTAFSVDVADAYIFIHELAIWQRTLKGRKESILYEIAADEYGVSLLNVCQGQYRNAFKGLRLVMEL